MQKLSGLGIYIPANPRSYFEDLMHINEQTPESLERTLRIYFPYVEVWTASNERFLEWFGKNCPYDTVCDNNSIYAIATHSAETSGKIYTFVDEIRDYKLERNEIDISIQAEIGTQPAIYNNSSVKVRIKNNSTKRIRVNATFPIIISYHIASVEGDIVVFDGKRTKIVRDILPGDVVEQFIGIHEKNDLFDNNTQYNLILTVVQEGVLWFDEVNSEFSCEVAFQKQVLSSGYL